MLSHALLTFYRSVSRHRLYAALNVFGLAAGIAVFLVLTLVVRYERSFDRWIPDAGNIYRLDTTYTLPGQAPFDQSASTFVASALLRVDYPQIRAITRQMRKDAPVSVGQTIDSEPVVHVDANFLDVIELPLLAGDRAHALSSPASVVITERVAKKFFGATPALGKSLDVSYDGTKHGFTITAVLKDLPSTSTLQIRLLVPFTSAFEASEPAFHRWGASSGETYLRFRNPAAARVVAADLRGFIHRHDGEEGPHPENYTTLSLVTLTGAHFHDVSTMAPVPGVDRRVVFSLGMVGLLALITAVINYVNLATARSGLRAREVALRKVMGATRRMLLLQFLGEAVALVALAALIGLALTELAIPVVNALGGYGAQIDYLYLVPLLAMLVLAVGLGAGCYPAMLLAAYRPAAVLASGRAPAGGRKGTRLRNLLVLAQFASAIAFGVCTLVIDSQAAFLRDADRGFAREGLIVVDSLAAKELMQRQNVILDAMRRVPGVVSATQSDSEPNSNYIQGTGVRRPGLAGPEPNLNFETVGSDYFRTYGIHLVAGRIFDTAHRMDDRAGVAFGGDPVTTNRSFNAIINRQAVSALGFADPRAALD
jgi:putative ABC transport system permease protein